MPGISHLNQFTDQASLREYLSTIANAKSLAVNTQGQIIPVDFFSTKFSGVSTNRRLLELKIMEILAHGKKYLGAGDIELVKCVAQKAGLVLENKESFINHRALRFLVGQIANQPVSHEKSSLKDDAQLCEAFRFRYQNELAAEYKQCEQITRTFAQIINDEEEAYDSSEDLTEGFTSSGQDTEQQDQELVVPVLIEETPAEISDPIFQQIVEKAPEGSAAGLLVIPDSPKIAQNSSSSISTSPLNFITNEEAALTEHVETKIPVSKIRHSSQIKDSGLSLTAKVALGTLGTLAAGAAAYSLGAFNFLQVPSAPSDPIKPSDPITPIGPTNENPVIDNQIKLEQCPANHSKYTNGSLFDGIDPKNGANQKGIDPKHEPEKGSGVGLGLVVTGLGLVAFAVSVAVYSLFNKPIYIGGKVINNPFLPVPESPDLTEGVDSEKSDMENGSGTETSDKSSNPPKSNSEELEKTKLVPSNEKKVDKKDAKGTQNEEEERIVPRDVIPKIQITGAPSPKGSPNVSPRIESHKKPLSRFEETQGGFELSPDRDNEILHPVLTSTPSAGEDPRETSQVSKKQNDSDIETRDEGSSPHGSPIVSPRGEGSKVSDEVLHQVHQEIGQDRQQPNSNDSRTSEEDQGDPSPKGSPVLSPRKKWSRVSDEVLHQVRQEIGQDRQQPNPNDSRTSEEDQGDAFINQQSPIGSPRSFENDHDESVSDPTEGDDPRETSQNDSVTETSDEGSDQSGSDSGELEKTKPVPSNEQEIGKKDAKGTQSGERERIVPRLVIPEIQIARAPSPNDSSIVPPRREISDEVLYQVRQEIGQDRQQLNPNDSHTSEEDQGDAFINQQSPIGSPRSFENDHDKSVDESVSDPTEVGDLIEKSQNDSVTETSDEGSDPSGSDSGELEKTKPVPSNEQEIGKKDAKGTQSGERERIVPRLVIPEIQIARAPSPNDSSIVPPRREISDEVLYQVRQEIGQDRQQLNPNDSHTSEEDQGDAFINQQSPIGSPRSFENDHDKSVSDPTEVGDPIGKSQVSKKQNDSVTETSDEGSDPSGRDSGELEKTEPVPSNEKEIGKKDAKGTQSGEEERIVPRFVIPKTQITGAPSPNDSPIVPLRTEIPGEPLSPFYKTLGRFELKLNGDGEVLPPAPQEIRQDRQQLNPNDSHTSEEDQGDAFSYQRSPIHSPTFCTRSSESDHDEFVNETPEIVSSFLDLSDIGAKLEEAKYTFENNSSDAPKLEIAVKNLRSTIKVVVETLNSPRPEKADNIMETLQYVVNSFTPRNEDEVIKFQPRAQYYQRLFTRDPLNENIIRAKRMDIQADQYKLALELRSIGEKEPGLAEAIERKKSVLAQLENTNRKPVDAKTAIGVLAGFDTQIEKLILSSIINSVFHNEAVKKMENLNENEAAFWNSYTPELIDEWKSVFVLNLDGWAKELDLKYGSQELILKLLGVENLSSPQRLELKGSPNAQKLTTDTKPNDPKTPIKFSIKGKRKDERITYYSPSNLGQPATRFDFEDEVNGLEMKAADLLSTHSKTDPTVFFGKVDEIVDGVIEGQGYQRIDGKVTESPQKQKQLTLTQNRKVLVGLEKVDGYLDQIKNSPAKPGITSVKGDAIPVEKNVTAEEVVQDRTEVLSKRALGFEQLCIPKETPLIAALRTKIKNLDVQSEMCKRSGESFGGYKTKRAETVEQYYSFSLSAADAVDVYTAKRILIDYSDEELIILNSLLVGFRNAKNIKQPEGVSDELWKLYPAEVREKWAVVFHKNQEGWKRELGIKESNQLIKAILEFIPQGDAPPVKTILTSRKLHYEEAVKNPDLTVLVVNPSAVLGVDPSNNIHDESKN